MPCILVTGSIAYDILLSYDGSFADAINTQSLESFSVSFFSPHYAKHRGGTGANIAWNIAVLGGKSLLVGAVGDDGTPYKGLLSERGVDTTHVETISGSVTATAIIGTDTGERQIAFFHPGADSHGTWPDLSQERDDLAYAIVGARDAKAMREAVEWCKKFSVPLLFDPGQQVIAFGNDELLHLVRSSTGIIVNEYEWSLLRKKIQCTEKSILKEVEYLIVTHGEKGSTLYESAGTQDVAACPADKVVNPTGAGDAFRGGLLCGLSNGWTRMLSMRLGASMGSFVVEQEGTLIDMLDIDEVRERARRTYGEELPESD